MEDEQLVDHPVDNPLDTSTKESLTNDTSEGYPETERDRAKREQLVKQIDPSQLRKRLAAPNAQYQVSKGGEKEKEKKNETLAPISTLTQNTKNGKEKTFKDYVCDKCKLCDEFYTKKVRGTRCEGCGCDLIFHLRDGDESPTEDDIDAYEWNDDDDE